MPLYGRRTSKPNPGVGIDWSQPLAQRLGGFYAFNEGAGPVVHDVVGRADLTVKTASTWGTFQGGSAVVATATGAGCYVPLPVQPVYPVSFAVSLRSIGTPFSGPVLGGCWNTGNSVHVWDFSTTAAFPLILNWLSGTTSQSVTTSYTIPANTDLVLSATITPTQQFVYVNGQLVGSSTTATSAPTYNVPDFACSSKGPSDSTTRSGFATYWAGWWTRALSTADHESLAARPWGLFLPPSFYRIFPVAIALTPTGINGTAKGTPALSVGSVALTPTGVSGTSPGTPALSVGSIALTPTGVTGTSPGTPDLSIVSPTLTPTGITGTAPGTPALSIGSVTLQPTGVTSTSPGTPVLSAGSVLTLTGITGTSTGTPALSVGSVSLQPTGVTGTSTGTPALSVGGVSLTPSGITSTSPGVPVLSLPTGTRYVTARRSSKPNPGVGVDRGHPLSAGLAGAWLFNERAGTTVHNAVNPVYDGVAQSANTALDSTWTSSPYGSALAHGPAHANSGFGFPSLTSTTTFTFSTWVLISPTASSYGNLLTNGGASGFWVLGNKLDLYFGGDHTSTTAAPASTWVNWTAVVNNGNLQYYLNGVPDGSYTGVPTLLFNTMLCDGGSAENLNGTISHQYLWVGRALTAQDVQELYQNPWQVFTPHRIFGSGPGSIPLVPTGINGTAKGTPALSVGSVALTPTGVSGTSPGTPALSVGSIALTPTGVTGTSPGDPVLSVGSLALVLSGVEGTTSGTPVLTYGSLALVLSGVEGTTAGTPDLSVGSLLVLSGVAGTTAGTPDLILLVPTVVDTIVGILTLTTGLPYRPYYRPQTQGESEAITYEIRKRMHTEKLAGAAGQATLWLDLTSWSYTYATAIANAALIRATLDDRVLGVYVGFTIEAAVYESDRHLIDLDLANGRWLYSVASTYRIVFTESLPNSLED